MGIYLAREVETKMLMINIMVNVVGSIFETWDKKLDTLPSADLVLTVSPSWFI